MGNDVKIRATQVAVPTSTGLQDITISGFGTVKAALFIMADAPTLNSPSNGARISFGMTDGTNSYMNGISSNDAVATMDTFRATSTGGIARGIGGTSFGVLDSLITDGVRIDWQVVDASNPDITVILFGGDDLSVSVGTKDANGGVVSTGYQPDIVIVSGIGNNGATGTGSNAILNIGFSDGTSEMGFCFSDADNQASSVITSYMDSNNSTMQVFSGSQTWAGSIGSFTSTGFSFSASGNSGDDVIYMALKLGDSLGHFFDIVDLPGTTGDQSISGVGFQSQFGLVIPTTLTAEDAIVSGAAGGAFGIGVFDADLNEYCGAYASEGSAATSNTECQNSDSVISINQDDGTAGFDATMSSLSSDGWTWNFSAVPGTTRKALVLAVEDPEAGGFPQLLNGGFTQGLFFGGLVG